MEVSLIYPDFTGLWSVAKIGAPDQKKWWSKPLGTFLLLCLICSWIGGFLSPFILTTLCFYKYYKTFTILLCIILYPYVFKIKPSSFAARTWIHSLHYFDGGGSTCYEHPPIDDDDDDNNNLKDLNNNDDNIIDNKIKKNPKYTPYIHLYHPHGIFTFGYCFNTGLRKYAISDQSNIEKKKYIGNVNLLKYPIPEAGIAAPILCRAPLFKHICVDLTGCIKPASKQQVNYFFEKKQSFGVTPGGFYEASFFEKDKDFIWAKDKKALIKYGLQNGYRIIIAYTFGECKTYWNLKGFRNIRLFLNKYSLPGILFHGPWFCPILPYSNTGLHTIHGRGFQLPKIRNPTLQQIDQYHEKYLQEMKNLFDRNKWRFGMNDAQLEIY